MICTALKVLDASFNQLEILPPLGELRKAEEIMFQSNNLKKFPDISGCSALTVLHLDNNNILVCVNIYIYYLRLNQESKIQLFAQNILSR